MPGRADPTSKVVGEQMQRARESMQLDQGEAGARIGITAARWGSYERGERSLPLDKLRLLPRAFHRPVTFFLRLPDERGLEAAEQEIISLERAIKDSNLRQAALEITARQLQAQVTFYQREFERSR